MNMRIKKRRKRKLSFIKNDEYVISLRHIAIKQQVKTVIENILNRIVVKKLKSLIFKMELMFL